MEKENIAIERLIESARQLHTLPVVAMEVLELTNNPVVDAQALKQCIERDVALTAKLLRVVNSSLFGLSREVSDLNQALALLGTKPLKLLVLGFSLPPGLFDGASETVRAQYWRHALTKAVAAREISQTIWNRPGDDVFIAGLLQDIGEMLLVEELGLPYIRLLEKSFAGAAELKRLEIESMGFDHTALSSRLLDHWQLPDALVRTVSWNVDAETLKRMSPGERAERRILHLAELIARLLADGDAKVLSELLDAGREDHNLSKNRLNTLVEDLQEKVENLADVLSLRLEDSPNGPGGAYSELLRRAHEQLTETAASAAEDMMAARLGIEAQKETKWTGAAEAQALAEELRSLGSAVNRIAERGLVKENRSQAADNGRPVLETSGRVNPVPVAVSVAKHDAATAASDPVLLDCLASMVAACRRARCSLSLLMVELDRTDELRFAHGEDGYRKACRFLKTACSDLDFPDSIFVPIGDASFAMILPGCDRREVAAPAHELIEAVGMFDLGSGPGGGDSQHERDRPKARRPVLSIGVGAATVAMPPKNFPPESLVESASRCLYGSLASGGGVFKSIEIYY